MKRMIVVAVLALAVAFLGTPANAANTLSVTSTAAMNSTGTACGGSPCGLQMNFDASTNNIYVQDDNPTDETNYVARFWVDPGTVALANNKSIRIAALGDDVNSQHVVLFLRHDVPDGSTNQWQLNFWYRVDGSGTSTFTFGGSRFLTTDAARTARQVEVGWTAASAPGANDGVVYIKRIDNGATTTVSSLDTDTFQVDNIRCGALANSGQWASSGAIFFDEFESYR